MRNHSGRTHVLQHRLSSVWSEHFIAGANTVTVVDASAGVWHGKPKGADATPDACASPALWFFVVGHPRTFSWTVHHLRAVARASVAGRPGCAFVAAFVPDEVDASLAAYTPGALGRVDAPRLHEALRRHPTSRVSANSIANSTSSLPPSVLPSVSSLLRHAASTTFSDAAAPSFAYAIVQRSGAVARYPACLALYWHGVYTLASWAAHVHGHGSHTQCTRSHTLPHAHSHTLPHTPTPSHTLPHTPTHSHTLPHTPTHSHTLPHTPTHSHTGGTHRSRSHRGGWGELRPARPLPRVQSVYSRCSLWRAVCARCVGTVYTCRCGEAAAPT
jgi:hypothetical protein